MKIKKPILIKEQTLNKTDEENLLQELNETVPLNVNKENPIEADKEIELNNNTMPAERDNIGNIINDLNRHETELSVKQDDNEKLEKELTTEQKKKILSLLSKKYNINLFLSTESEEILNSEINRLKENFNDDIFKTIVQDLESVKNLFREVISLLENREELVTSLLRRLDNPKLPDDIFKEYDLSNYMNQIGTIRNFIHDNKLERLIGCLLFIIKESKIDLSKEDNEIFDMLNSSKPEDKSKIENNLKRRIREDLYTAELNKRSLVKHTLFGTVLNKNIFETYLDNYFLTTVQIDSNMTEFMLNSELNSFSTLLNEIKNTYINFKDEAIEDMKILEKKYDSVISVIKGSISKLNSPNQEDTEILWRNLILIRTFYISVMSKRLGDRMLAHYILAKLMIEILN